VLIIARLAVCVFVIAQLARGTEISSKIYLPRHESEPQPLMHHANHQTAEHPLKNKTALHMQMPTYLNDMQQKTTDETLISVNSGSLLMSRRQMTLGEYNTLDWIPHMPASDLSDSTYLTKHSEPCLILQEMAI